MCREATAPQGRAGTRLAVSGRVASANTSLVRGWLPSVTMLAKHRVGSHSCMDCYQMCVCVCVCVSLPVMGCQCVKASLNLKAAFCEHFLHLCHKSSTTSTIGCNIVTATSGQIANSKSAPKYFPRFPSDFTLSFFQIALPLTFFYLECSTCQCPEPCIWLTFNFLIQTAHTGSSAARIQFA